MGILLTLLFGRGLPLAPFPSNLLGIVSAPSLSRAASVFWHKLVWHRKAIPRHAFILWLATFFFFDFFLEQYLGFPENRWGRTLLL